MADGPNDNYCSIEESLGYDIDEFADDGVNKLKIELYQRNHIS